jgi:hypothetical protein
MPSKKAYADTAELAPLAWLIGRVRADFVTAVEATQSGYVGVATDTMRDLMEIEAPNVRTAFESFEKRNLARQPGQVTGWSQLRRQG